MILQSTKEYKYIIGNAIPSKIETLFNTTPSLFINPIFTVAFIASLLVGNTTFFVRNSDVTNTKPDPEGINKALRLLNSKKALYVGDGVSDILAGKNAQIDTVGVLYSNRKDQIIAANPTYTIKDLNEILVILVE